MREQTRLERTRHVVRGERSELRLEDGAITLVKEATTQTRPTSITVAIDRVRGTTLERPTARQRGWLHLAVVDGTPTPPSELAAASDPYTLPLSSRQVPAARRLIRMITDHVQRRGLPHQDERTPARPSTGVIVTSAAPPPEPTRVDGAPRRVAGESEPTAPSLEPTAPNLEPTAPNTEPSAPATEEALPGAAPPGDGHQLIGQLRELADLHRQGALSDDEFERAKQRVLDASAAD
jgi:hypothetical protein